MNTLLMKVPLACDLTAIPSEAREGTCAGGSGIIRCLRGRTTVPAAQTS